MIKLPEDFKIKYERLLGKESHAFFQAFEQPIQKGYRINPLKNNVNLIDTIDEGQVPYGKWGHFGPVFGHSIDHVTGVVYSQEPSAQFVAEVLHPNPGERVLDLAAAPGGKSTHLAAFMQQDGLLWSNEIFMSRAKILSENIERIGVQNTIVSSQTPAELSQQLPHFFDKILLDAPCSGEGMFRKNAIAVTQWHHDFPQELADLQQEILREAVKMLRPGGELVYSTCTFSPEEDEQMIAWLLQEYPDFIVETIVKTSGSHISDGHPEWADKQYTDGVTTESRTATQIELKKTARLWPQKLNGEGHFVAKLKLSEHAIPTPQTIQDLKPQVLDRDRQEILNAFIEETMRDFSVSGRQWVLFGERLYLAPNDTPDISKMKIVRLGLEMGTFKKKRFEPAHALALALHPKQFKQYYELSHDDWAKFVHGDVIRPDSKFEKGWILLIANGNGVGWGRYVDGQIKNFFPKGLRFVVKPDDNTLSNDNY